MPHAGKASCPAPDGTSISCPQADLDEFQTVNTADYSLFVPADYLGLEGVEATAGNYGDRGLCHTHTLLSAKVATQVLFNNVSLDPSGFICTKVF